MLDRKLKRLLKSATASFVALSLVATSILPTLAFAKIQNSGEPFPDGSQMVVETDPEKGSRTGVRPADGGEIDWRSEFLKNASTPAAPPAIPPAPVEPPATPPVPVVDLNLPADPSDPGVTFVGAPTADGSAVVKRLVPDPNDPAGPVVEQFGHRSADGKIEWRTDVEVPRYFHKELKAYSPEQLQIIADGMLTEPPEVATESLKPSRIGEFLRKLGEKAKAAPGKYANLRSDAESAQASGSSGPAGSERVQKIKSTAKNFSAGLLSFYAALGVVAASKIYSNYPNDPIAWQKFTDNFSDPVGMMMSVAFMGVLYGSMSKVKGFTTPGSVINAVPPFAKGMGLALALQFVLTYVFNKDVDSCAMSTVTPNHPRDVAACDRAYQLFTSENMSLQWMPVIANLTASTGLYLGAQYVSSVTGMTAFLRGLPLWRSSKGNWVALVLGSMVFIEAQNIATAYLKVEKVTTAALLSDWSLSTNQYGGGTSPVERNLYQTWGKLKQNNMVDFTPMSPKKSAECQLADAAIRDGYGIAIFAGMNYPTDCAKQQLDFGGVLDRYSLMQATWRNRIGLWETNIAYQGWLAKIAAYHLSIQYAVDYYIKAVDLILKEKANPQLKPEESFGPEFTHSQQEVIDGGHVNLEPTGGVWHYVKTNQFTDFLVASMACGPEAEGYSAESHDGMWPTVRNFMTDRLWNFMNIHDLDAHDRMIVNPTGQSVLFFPPRLTTPHAGQSLSVCEANRPLISTGLRGIDRRLPEKFSISPGMFRSGPSYANLYEYLKKNIRPEIIAGGKNHFLEWFTANVSPQILAVEEQLRGEYEKMLEDVYRKNLTETSYYHCDLDSDVDPGLANTLDHLMISNTTTCKMHGTHRLANGIFESLHDEFRLYLGLMVDNEVNQNLAQGSTNASGVSRKLYDLANEGLKAFDDRNMLLTAFPAALAADPNQLKQVIDKSVANSGATIHALLNELADTHPGLKTLDDNCVESRKSPDVTVRLTCKLLGLINEGARYGDILLLTYTEHNKLVESGDLKAPAEAPPQKPAP